MTLKLTTKFRAMIEIMVRVCKERKWDCVDFHGGMKMDARDKAVKKFQEDKDCLILLAGLKAGGVGLNLTAGNRVIIIDLWWNQFVETQAFCRVYRIGQQREVEVVWRGSMEKSLVDDD
jgi:SNF2 family DNA or RNA helicase